jgi:hypothetical protein
VATILKGAGRDLKSKWRRTHLAVAPAWRTIQEQSLLLQDKVLSLFNRAGVSESDFAPSTVYGYADRGRAKLDRIFAGFFGAEKALVRPQIVSGTHAIALALLGLDLREGDELRYFLQNLPKWNTHLYQENASTVNAKWLFKRSHVTAVTGDASRAVKGAHFLCKEA